MEKDLNEFLFVFLFILECVEHLVEFVGFNLSFKRKGVQLIQ